MCALQQGCHHTTARVKASREHFERDVLRVDGKLFDFVLIDEFLLTVTWNYTSFCPNFDSHNFTR